MRQGEAAHGNRDAADQHHKKFKKMIEEGGFVLQQVFNCDETGCFWKRMPRRTYIMKVETTLPGHKLMRTDLHCSFVPMLRGTARSNHCLCTTWRTPELLKTSG